MAISAQQVHDYLDKHPIRCYEDDLDTFLEVIHYAYISRNSINSTEIKDLFRSVSDILDKLSFSEADRLTTLICQLCYHHEYLSFSHGLSVGMRIMHEISDLP